MASPKGASVVTSTTTALDEIKSRVNQALFRYDQTEKEKMLELIKAQNGGKARLDIKLSTDMNDFFNIAKKRISTITTRQEEHYEKQQGILKEALENLGSYAEYDQDIRDIEYEVLGDDEESEISLIRHGVSILNITNDEIKQARRNYELTSERMHLSIDDFRRSLDNHMPADDDNSLRNEPELANKSKKLILARLRRCQDAREALEIQNDDLKTKVNKLESELKLTNASNESYKATLDELQEELSRLKDQLIEMEDLQNGEAFKKRRRASLQESSEINEILEDMKIKHTAEMTDLRTQVASFTKEKQKMLASHQTALKKKSKEMESLRQEQLKQATKFRSENDELRSRVTSLTKAIEEKQRRVRKSSIKAPQLPQEAQEQVHRVAQEQLKAQLKELSQQLSLVRIDNEDLKEQVVEANNEVAKKSIDFETQLVELQTAHQLQLETQESRLTEEYLREIGTLNEGYNHRLNAFVSNPQSKSTAEQLSKTQNHLVAVEKQNHELRLQLKKKQHGAKLEHNEVVRKQVSAISQRYKAILGEKDSYYNNKIQELFHQIKKLQSHELSTISSLEEEFKQALLDKQQQVAATTSQLAELRQQLSSKSLLATSSHDGSEALAAVTATVACQTEKRMDGVLLESPLVSPNHFTPFKPQPQPQSQAEQHLNAMITAEGVGSTSRYFNDDLLSIRHYIRPIDASHLKSMHAVSRHNNKIYDLLELSRDNRTNHVEDNWFYLVRLYTYHRCMVEDERLRTLLKRKQYFIRLIKFKRIQIFKSNDQFLWYQMKQQLLQLVNQSLQTHADSNLDVINKLDALIANINKMYDTSVFHQSNSEQLSQAHLHRIKAISPFFPANFNSFSTAFQQQLLYELMSYILTGNRDVLVHLAFRGAREELRKQFERRVVLPTKLHHHQHNSSPRAVSNQKQDQLEQSRLQLELDHAVVGQRPTTSNCVSPRRRHQPTAKPVQPLSFEALASPRAESPAKLHQWMQKSNSTRPATATVMMRSPIKTARFKLDTCLPHTADACGQQPFVFKQGKPLDSSAVYAQKSSKVAVRRPLLGRPASAFKQVNRKLLSQQQQQRGDIRLDSNRSSR